MMAEDRKSRGRALLGAEIRADRKREFRVLAAKRGMSQSELLREAINTMLEEAEETTPGDDAIEADA